VAARVKGSWALVPLGGGAPRPLRIPTDDRPLSFTADGRGLFVHTFDAPRMVLRVYRYDLATGKRRPWRDLVPPDVAGANPYEGRHAVITPDGRWYAHGYLTQEDELYVVDGLR